MTLLINGALTIFVDWYLRRISGPPKHAHQEVERSTCDWHGCSELCSPPAVSWPWFG